MAAKRRKLPATPADARISVEPTVRTYRLWSVDTVRLAEASADGGTISKAAELCDALLGDDRIPAVLQTRTQGLLGLRPTFEPSGDGRRRNRAVRAIEAGEDWWAMVPESESAHFLAWGELLGIAPGELRWFHDDGSPIIRDGRNVPELRFRHPKFLRYDATVRQWLITVADGQEIPFTPGDGRWFAHCPFGMARPWQSGAWRGLVRWWLLKQYAIADWGEHGERGASLFVESTLDADTTRELRKQLASDLAQMASQGVCVLPPGFQAKLLEITANTTAIYDAQVNAANTAASIRILGHNLTSEVSGGSFAASQTGDGIRLDLRKFDAETWSDATHRQISVHWARVNFGDEGLAPWAVYPVEPKADRKMVAEELDVLSRALVQLDAAPAYIDKQAILEERGVPLVKGASFDRPDPPAALPPLPPSVPEPADDENDEDEDPEEDEEELTRLGRYDGLKFTPPKGVRQACRRGLDLHEAGHSGDGLRPATVAWARRLAAGQPITPDKARRMRAWLARHASDRRPGWHDPPTPGYVAWLLWGGDDAVPWSADLVRQMDKVDATTNHRGPVALASTPRQAVMDGMLWSDAVADAAAPVGRDALAEHVNAVLDAIQQATGYDDLKARMLTLLDGDSPGFREAIYRAMVLSEGRGALSVVEES